MREISEFLASRVNLSGEPPSNPVSEDLPSSTPRLYSLGGSGLPKPEQAGPTDFPDPSGLFFWFRQCRMHQKGPSRLTQEGEVGPRSSVGSPDSGVSIFHNLSRASSRPCPACAENSCTLALTPWAAMSFFTLSKLALPAP